ncbi:hypothetical protein MLD38_013571 [Melastoma candidum]|nr:hypothetical protein MLD38_013571 [Melastoma candidum]
MTFCPALLQVWFYTHLGITGEAFTREHTPGLLARIVERARLPIRTFVGVDALFRSMEPADFYQRAPCFDTDDAITSSTDGYFIPFMGFGGTSYYASFQVRHQLGLTPKTRAPPQQLFRPLSLDDKVVKTALQRVIAHISRIWMTLTEEICELPPELEEEDRAAQSQCFWRKRHTQWDRL